MSHLFNPWLNLSRVASLCVAATHFVAEHFGETAGRGLIAVGSVQLGKLATHCLNFVRLALDGVTQVVGIAAYQAEQLSFFGQVLKALHKGCLFKQISQL
jgi:hypothetical protein